MARKSKRVYVPQVDQIFNSITDAAKALGVNAANLSKTLTGKRKTAGGFSLVDASPTTTKDGKIKKPNRRSLRRKSDPLYSQRIEFQKILESVNKNMQDIRTANLEYFASAAKNAMSFIDDIGRTKDNYYKTDYTTLSQLSENELEKYTAAIKRYQKQSTYKKNGAEINAEVIANRIGLTGDILIHYSSILPLIFGILDNVYALYESDDVIEEAVELMDNAASTEDVLVALEKASNYYDTLQLLTDMVDKNYRTVPGFENIRPALEELLNAYESKSVSASDVRSITDEVAQNIKYFNTPSFIEMIDDDVENILRNAGLK